MPRRISRTFFALLTHMWRRCGNPGIRISIIIISLMMYMTGTGLTPRPEPRWLPPAPSNMMRCCAVGWPLQTVGTTQRSMRPTVRISSAYTRMGRRTLPAGTLWPRRRWSRRSARWLIKWMRCMTLWPRRIRSTTSTWEPRTSKPFPAPAPTRRSISPPTSR